MVHSESMTQTVDTSTRTLGEDFTFRSPYKKQRVLPTGRQNVPVRILCSIGFLEQDELLDELCTEQLIFAIERNLPPPIDVLVDERNCICVVSQSTFQAEEIMQSFIFRLARLQVQLTKCWLVIAMGEALTSPDTEDMMNSFFVALTQFRIEIHVLTRIVSHFTAQSLLHKICMEDLFSKSLNELKLLVQNVVTDEQLEVLWRQIQYGQAEGLYNAANATARSPRIDLKIEDNGLSGLTNLSRLDISASTVEDLSFTAADISSLQEIVLSNNAFSTLPKFFYEREYPQEKVNISLQWTVPNSMELPEEYFANLKANIGKFTGWNHYLALRDSCSNITNNYTTPTTIVCNNGEHIAVESGSSSVVDTSGANIVRGCISITGMLVVAMLVATLI
ncbi:Hypothetical protein PHPALM_12577 [Phytophthora palmivora]|uniref:Uncharacterized protein n=1 Tax=Phytophthora palmivora TaxID=4796 RepID=A0A2P4XZE5_9STRA|nr:Hypothetical protein PHPALM_12577 [Phytophthora palmivora]